MQRVYLLLRDNRESGPHSYEELAKMGLRPFDLIWVEGKSQAWSYPSEIDALKQLVPGSKTPKETKQVTPEPPPQPTPVPQVTPAHPHVFVSLPNGRPPARKDEIEERAEALRRKVETFETKHDTVSHKDDHTDNIVTHYNRSMDDVSEEYSAWLYQAKTKRKKSFNPKHLVGGVIVAIGLAGGWWLGRMAFQTPSLTLAQQQSASNNLAKGPLQQQKTIIPVLNQPQEKQQELIVTADSLIVNASETPKTVEKPKVVAEEPVAKPESLSRKPVEINNQTDVASTPATQQPAAEEKNKPAETTAPATAEQKQETTEEPKKKKGFFAKLFGKKDKEEKSEAVSTVDLSKQVEIRLKDNAENWMMGVQGAKLSLRNESNTEVKSAAVEISYFSEQNTLLEKKTVHFNNVPAKKTKTIAIPDHRTAGRISYHLLSATGEEAAYARQ